MIIQITINTKYRILSLGSFEIISFLGSSGGSNGDATTIPRKMGIATRVIIGITIMLSNYTDYN